MTFKLIEFNPRRHMRGVEAAKVSCDGVWLWMSRGDLLRNIRDHGNDPELRAALVCYTRPHERYHHEMRAE